MWEGVKKTLEAIELAGLGGKLAPPFIALNASSEGEELVGSPIANVSDSPDDLLWVDFFDRDSLASWAWAFAVEDVVLDVEGQPWHWEGGDLSSQELAILIHHGFHGASG